VAEAVSGLAEMCDHCEGRVELEHVDLSKGTEDAGVDVVAAHGKVTGTVDSLSGAG